MLIVLAGGWSVERAAVEGMFGTGVGMMGALLRCYQSVSDKAFGHWEKALTTMAMVLEDETS